MMRRTAPRGAELPSQTSDVLVRYAGAIGEPITVTGTITRKEKVLGRRYSTVSTLLEINCGTSIITLFSAARWAHAAQVGEQVTVTGTVKKHQYWRGTPQTLLGWTTRIDNPAPTTSNEALRVGDGWPAGEVTIRRRFPDNPNPATPPRATSTAACTVRGESMTKIEPRQLGWPIGVASEPHAGPLWCPWDRTCGVIGPQGSGKTLDLLTPALLAAPGAALVTLTKTDDLLLTIGARRDHERPCVVLDPFGQADGLPELIWDPIAGCVDPLTAERRAKAFTNGTIRNTTSGGSGDAAARFYAAEAAKVLQCYLHAAALVGHRLDRVLRWVANPHGTAEPADILREHPHAALHWHGLLQGALHGDERTSANTITTVQQAMELFFQPAIRNRCIPSDGRPATDIAQVIRSCGTFYLLGREDPYASASPLMTALAEHILDTALKLANASPWGRLCPPMLACLDELPSTAPLPTLRTRMANERALGISIIYAAQTWRQLAALFGDTEARAILGLTNLLALFGGSKDVAFNKEVSDLVGTVRVARTSWQFGGRGGRIASGEDMQILRPEEIRQLPERHALIVAENTRPIIAKLRRSIDGKPGRALLAQQAAVRADLARRRGTQPGENARAIAALTAARKHGLLE